MDASDRSAPAHHLGSVAAWSTTPAAISLREDSVGQGAKCPKLPGSPCKSFRKRSRRPDRHVVSGDGFGGGGALPLARASGQRRRRGETQVNKVFRQVRQMAALPKSLDVHACRHTFASWLLSEGEMLYRVSWWMGHSRISITADTYGHLQQTESEAGRRIFSEGLPPVQ